MLSHQLCSKRWRVHSTCITCFHPRGINSMLLLVGCDRTFGKAVETERTLQRSDVIGTWRQSQQVHDVTRAPLTCRQLGRSAVGERHLAAQVQQRPRVRHQLCVSQQRSTDVHVCRRSSNKCLEHGNRPGNLQYTFSQLANGSDMFSDPKRCLIHLQQNWNWN